MRRVLSAIAVTSCLIIGFPIVISAQSLPGFTIFSGIKRKPAALPLRFWGQSNGWDRYRLRIPAKKLNLAVAQFSISYPDYYKGKFDPDKIEVRIKDKKCRSKR